MFCYIYLLVWLSMLAWIDWKEQRIPNKILLILFVSRLVFLFAESFFHQSDWKNIFTSSITGGMTAGGLLFFCYAFFRGSIGAGDVKIFAVLGAYLGSRAAFYSLMFSVFYAVIYCLLKLLQKKVTLKKKIAFAPFIFLGTITTMILQVSGF